jgi:transketolase
MSSIELARFIRRKSLEMVSQANASHIGSALSIADILAVLYSDVLRVDTQNPSYEDRDRFILSKGHATVALYAALAAKGFISQDELKTYGELNSRLMSHVSHKVPGIEFSTGSLGHGLPFGVGKALHAKKQKKTWKTYVLMSDGELAEGSNWESYLFARHHSLSNLVAIVDNNNLQSFTTIANTLNTYPIDIKLSAFDWRTLTINGHDHDDIRNALFLKEDSNRPLMIICNTIKGKGVDFMENKVEWHYKSPNAVQLKEAISQLDGAL